MDGNFGEILRNKVFWIVDTIKGKPVAKHYNSIDFYFNNPSKVKQHQDKEFKKIATFAKKNTQFYGQLNLSDDFFLSDFPIIDKNILKEKPELFFTDLAKENNVTKMHTSGSTGTPLFIIQDQNKRNRVYAEMMYLWGLSGYKVGMKYVFLRRWNNINKKSRITSTARNLVMEDVTKLDELTLDRIKNRLTHDKKIKMIIGYASTLDLLADYLKKTGMKPKDFSVKTILSGSEVLTDKTRKVLKEVFGCNVVSLYSNQENGMLAVECKENYEFHLNSASYIFEILKVDSNEIADYGEIGRLVITDLYNYAMPLLRYDTGDLAIRKQNAECVLQTEVISAIEGRKVDVVYNSKGEPLSPHTITNGLWKFDGLKQFQLIQKDKSNYEFRVNDLNNMYSDSELISTCKDFFGTDANVKIIRVNEIPVLASGKFKYLVSEWKPERK